MAPIDGQHDFIGMAELLEHLTIAFNDGADMRGARRVVDAVIGGLRE